MFFSGTSAIYVELLPLIAVTGNNHLLCNVAIINVVAIYILASLGAWVIALHASARSGTLREPVEPPIGTALASLEIIVGMVVLGVQQRGCCSIFPVYRRLYSTCKHE